MADETDVEIENPPFPSDDANTEQVYAYVVDFAAWTEKYRKEANTHAGRECVAALRSLPSLPFHMKLSILRLTTLFNSLRTLRCEWDAIVRTYERSWNSDKAKNARHLLMHRAVDVLNEAYLSGEMLEAHLEEKQQRAAIHQVAAGMQQAQQIFERMQKEYGPPTQDTDDAEPGSDEG